MRYILDNTGYIYDASIGAEIECDLGTCTEYTGVVPTGYDTIEDWFLEECDRLNAWKIVNGDLTFDEARYTRLEKLYDEQQKANAHVTNKDVGKYISGTTKQLAKAYKLVNSLEINGMDYKLLKLENTKPFPAELVSMVPMGTITDYIDLVVTNKNIFKNDATDNDINGLTFATAEDKTIVINGTSTALTEYDLVGKATNTSPIFAFKKDIEYVFSIKRDDVENGTTDYTDVSIIFYNYDGTNREEIYEVQAGTGETIKFTDADKLVTHVVLKIASNTTFTNYTFYPQLEVGTAQTEYIKPEYNIITIDLGSSTFEKTGIYASESTVIGEDVTITDGLCDMIVIDGDGDATLYKNNDVDEVYDLGTYTIDMFENDTVMFTIQDVILNASYRINVLDSDVEVTIYNNDGIELIGRQSGILTNFQFQSGNEYEFIGHAFNTTPQHGSYYERTKLTLRVDIPQNFTILSAVITLKHNNVWLNSDGNNFYGYSRHLKVYKGDDYSSVRKYLDTSLYYVDEDADYSEIENAFGVDGYTPPVPTDEDAQGTTVYSNDIKAELTTGNNTIIIRSGDELSDGTQEVEAAKQTGWCYAYMNVIGYFNVISEEE